MNLLSLVVLAVFVQTVQMINIKLGVNVPFTGTWPGGPKMASAVLIAIDRVNNDPSWLPGYTLTYAMKDSKCDEKHSIANLIDFRLEQPVADAFIGPGCSVGCLPGGHIADHWNVPMVAWGCAASALSDKTLYPTFVRTVGTFHGMSDLFKAFLPAYGWDRIALLCTTETLWSQTCNNLKTGLERNSSFTAPYFGSFDPASVSDYAIRAMLKAAKEKAHGMFLLEQYLWFCFAFSHYTFYTLKHVA